MKYIISIFAILTIASCSGDAGNNTDNNINSSMGIELEGKEPEFDTEPILGERIDGPANVRDTVNGKILFTLHNKVLVETTPTQGNWLQIGIKIKLINKENKDFTLLPNTDLFSVDGEIIGRTVDTVIVWMGDNGVGRIEAYTHIDNIDKLTVPEIILANEIENGNITKASLKEFIVNFGFMDYNHFEQLNLKQLFIYESVLEDPSPRDRISLLFDDLDELVGIVHSRPISTSEYKTYELARGHSLTIIKDLKEEKIKEIINKRVRFYNSVD